MRSDELRKAEAGPGEKPESEDDPGTDEEVVLAEDQVQTHEGVQAEQHQQTETVARAGGWDLARGQEQRNYKDK